LKASVPRREGTFFDDATFGPATVFGQVLLLRVTVGHPSEPKVRGAATGMRPPGYESIKAKK
jgi:hypothetical protein